MKILKLTLCLLLTLMVLGCSEAQKADGETPKEQKNKKKDKKIYFHSG